MNCPDQEYEVHIETGRHRAVKTRSSQSVGERWTRRILPRRHTVTPPASGLHDLRACVDRERPGGLRMTGKQWTTGKAQLE